MVETMTKETAGSSLYIWRWWKGGKQLLMVSELAAVCLSLALLNRLNGFPSTSPSIIHQHR